MWSNDERSGFGMMKFSSGEEFKGTWERDKFNGNFKSWKGRLSILVPYFTIILLLQAKVR
jgi:hypothetical protein